MLDKIITQVEQLGFCYIENSEIDPTKIKDFTDKYSLKYSLDAGRRSKRFESPFIRNVDYGTSQIDLHSETSFAPNWPELLTLFCLEAPEDGTGQTTLCDGAELYNALDPEIINYFQINPVRYDLEIPIPKNNLKGLRRWSFQKVGAGDAVIDWDKGILKLTQVRSAIVESRWPDKLSFCNHLLIHLDSEPQIKRRSRCDGSNIPEHILDTIRAEAEKLTKEIAWKKGDILIVDNKRMMHGRRAYSGTKRDIVVVQTEVAAFPYGTITRSRTSLESLSPSDNLKSQ